MKKIAKILFLSASLFCTTACSDFLDQTAPSEQPGENVLSSQNWQSISFMDL